ncbi:MAG: serine hydrolase domain-containing protein [Pseudomonadota bacterium]
MSKKIITTLALVLLSASALAEEIPVVKPEQVGMSADRLERVTDMMTKYVDPGKIAGLMTVVTRDGKIVYAKTMGKKGIDGDKPLADDDLFRIYSMTKPITAVAAMQLYEQGKFHMQDPVSKFVPEFKELTVMKDGKPVPAERQMTMQQLLSHTAGLSYGFDPNDPVDKLYQEANIWSAADLDEFAAKIAKLPLRYEPGTQWHYSIAVDITGLVVQRLSGMPFDKYLEENLFKPLGMVDTFFEVPADKMSRFLPNHRLDRKIGKPVLTTTADLPGGEANCRAMCDYAKVTLFSGGGGLVSTTRDYLRFAQAVANGGELHGVRILSPKTVAYMATNHLPASVAGGGNGEQPTLAGASMNGFGFGLGFGIITNPTESGIMGSTGEYYWGGAAGTVFWIDPVENIVAVSMMQLMGSWRSYRPDLKVAVNQAIINSKAD